MAPRSRGGRWVIVPDGQSAAEARLLARRARRRQTRILFVLVVIAVGTGAWALVSGGVAMAVHVAVDLMALTYGVVVIGARRRRAEQNRKVWSMARHPVSSPRTPWPEIDRKSIAL